MTPSIRVLVVEDERPIRSSLTAFLMDLGFNTWATNSAEEALMILRQKPIDVAIVDIRLHKMDGNTLILKAHEVQGDLKFLIHTGSTDYVLPGSLMKIGLKPEHVFKKPVRDLREIVNAIYCLAGAAPIPS